MKIEIGIMQEVLEAIGFLEVEEKVAADAVRGYRYNWMVETSVAEKLMEQIKESHGDWEFGVIDTVAYMDREYRFRAEINEDFKGN